MRPVLIGAVNIGRCISLWLISREFCWSYQMGAVVKAVLANAVVSTRVGYALTYTMLWWIFYCSKVNILDLLMAIFFCCLALCLCALCVHFFILFYACVCVKAMGSVLNSVWLVLALLFLRHLQYHCVWAVRKQTQKVSLTLKQSGLQRQALWSVQTDFLIFFVCGGGRGYLFFFSPAVLVSFFCLFFFWRQLGSKKVIC